MILKKGSEGAEVRTVTAMLAQLELLPKPTGTFDAEVARAVSRFQAQHVDSRGEPLLVDGIVGPLTRRALEEATGRRPATEASRPRVQMPTGGSPLARAALEVALREFERGAGESGRDNRGPDVERYLDGRVPPGSDWCAGFVSHCYREGARAAGVPMPFEYSVGARAILAQFRRKGWQHVASHQSPPAPGDVIVWWRRALSDWRGHIGLVHSYEDGIVRTIEGNHGAFPCRVNTFQYVLGRIDRLLGFGRVP